MDDRAPAGFSPPRHVHREDDETMILHQGRLVLWTPAGLSVANPGDVVYLPRRKPHTWYNASDGAIELTLMVTPGQFEPFFPLLAQKRLTQDDVEGSCSIDVRRHGLCRAAAVGGGRRRVPAIAGQAVTMVRGRRS